MVNNTRVTKFIISASTGLLLLGCESQTAYNPLNDFEQLDPASIFAAPNPVPTSSYTVEQTSRGQYLVGLLGCGSCHTDGAVNLP